MKRSRIFFNIPFLLTVLYTGTAVAQAPRAVPSDYPSNTPANYIRTWDVKAPEQNANDLMTRPLRDVQQSTQYFDGLGRPLQAVVKQGSYTTGGTAVDMISMREYDALGREPFQYLTTPSTATGATKDDGSFKVNPFAQQAVFYGGSGSLVAGQGETFYYGEAKFESSPLNRVTEMAAPGNAWAGSMYQSTESDRHSVKTKYYINTTTDEVRMWKVDVAAVGSLSSYTSPGTYAAGELYKSVVIDEQNKQVIEFRDKGNKVILKKVQLTAANDDGSGSGHDGWLCTYYIYDNRNNLRGIVSPRGVELISSDWILTNTTILTEQCFRYEYDQRNRLIIKKVPGADPVEMIYDDGDKLVMTQDAKLKVANQYLVIIYDVLNRPVETGLWTNTSTPQTHRDNAYHTTGYPTISGTYEYLTKTGYDDYAAVPTASGLNAVLDEVQITGAYGFFTTYDTSPDYAQQLTASLQTRGLVTWTETRIPGESVSLYDVNIYDDRARLIQVKSKNQTGGIDIVTTQYSWSGLPLVVLQKYVKSGTNPQTGITITKLIYDDLGRVVRTDKKIQHTEVESNALPPAYTTVSENEYDALGRLQKKTVGSQKNPSNNTYYNPRQPLQEQVYEYNIRGWLLNMNKGYMSNANTNQYFSMELGYDKDASIGTFTDRYDGNISGVIWKSEGDQQQRKYDFTYDDANRLTAGEFTQYVSGLGSSAVFNTSAGVDYSVSGLTYDANGNIKTVTRKGLILNTSPVIDQLTYSHKDAGYSNRLAKVTDAATSANSGKLGDFNDGNVGGTDDYGYDINGNLTADLNKGISSIMYNFLNLPQTVTMPGKGAITYVYDAVGNRLKKVTVEDPSAANGNRTITTTITYVGAFVYESKTVNPTDPGCPDYTDKLLFAGQEEGRIRAVYDPSDPNILTGFAYDYFVKDHLGNTRIVLTEEQKQDVYPAATMETAEAVTENIYYGNIDLTRFAKSGISGYPVDEATDPNDYVAKTDGDGNNIGPSIFLKVMAGDQFTVQVSSWYKKNSASPVTPADPLAALIAALAGGVSHASPVHGTATALINSGALDPSALGFLNSRDAPASGKPKAYLNWVLLDEQLKIAKDAGGNIIASGYSGADQVGGDEEFKTHAFANMPVKKSGYLYIYTSNETPNIDVFFDNLQVTHTKGPILEESHYYPYGMKMAGISSKAYGSLKNLYQYQGEYAEFDEDTGWNDFELRSYDAQTGRFIQQDPYDQFASPYMGMGNNPVSNMDPSGGWGIDLGTVGQITGSVLGDRLLAAGAGAALGYGIDKLTGGNGGWGAAIGAGVGFGATLIPPINFGSIGSALGKAVPSMAVHGANIALNAVTNPYARFAGGAGYQPLYKDFFLNYVRLTMCPNCGTGTLQNTAGLHFQDLFEDYIDENFAFDNLRVVKDPANNKLPGELRSTVPDYFGIKYSTAAKKAELTSFYELESFFELKATKNNVGVSSFDGQLKVQIQAAKRLKVREIIIITTYGVKLTRPLQNFASENGILLTHYWSQYMMLPGNKMKLNYTPAR